MTSRSSLWQFLCALCILGLLDRSSRGLVAALGCDAGPDVLTEDHGKTIPQTCIEVPSDENGSTMVSKRCYYTYVPDSCFESSAPVKAPLVLDIHGFGSCPSLQVSYSGWMETAEQDCMVLMWPLGNDLEGVDGTCWNLPGFLRSDDYGNEGGNNVETIPCCCQGKEYPPPKDPNDTLFLKMAIDKIVEDFAQRDDLSIDSSRIYAAGHSNGCMASLSMAALHSDTIAAVCCHAGSVVTPFPPNYSPVPIWMTHGVKDYDILWDGRPNYLYENTGFWSMDQIMDYLSEQNGCSEEIEEDLMTCEGQVGTLYRRKNCLQNASVELVGLSEAGHFPYKVPFWFKPIVMAYGETPTEIDTTKLAWQFCKSHSKGGTTADEVTTDEVTTNEVSTNETSLECSSRGFRSAMGPGATMSLFAILLGGQILAGFL